MDIFSNEPLDYKHYLYACQHINVLTWLITNLIIEYYDIISS